MAEKPSKNVLKTFEKVLKNAEKPAGNGFVRFLVVEVIETHPLPITAAQILIACQERGYPICKKTLYKILGEIRFAFSLKELKTVIVHAGKSRARAFYFVPKTPKNQP
jgi:hypothetical protein